MATNDAGQGPFKWDDPFLLEGQLREDESLAQQTARAFAQQNLKARVSGDYLNETCDRTIFQEMGKLGFFGIVVPEEYGGCGEHYVSYGLIAREIERVDSGYRSMMSVQSSLVIYPILQFGSDEQKRVLVPALVSGESVGSFCLTEPDAGSDPSRMVTTAEKIDGGWRINGAKTWISNAPLADIFVVWAKEKSEGPIRAFILRRGMRGLSTPKIHGKLSLRTSTTGEVIMDGVIVTDDSLLPDARGLKAALMCLSRARYGIAWGALGAAEDCWFRSHRYVLDRKQFGRPLAANQLVQKKLADMQTEIALGLQASLRVGRLMEAQLWTPEMVSLVKRNNSGKALEIARVARDLHGANGIHIEYAVMRHAQNLEAVNTYEGTHDIHALSLGRAQTGIQAFY